MSLVEIKGFNALIGNKPFSEKSVKNKQEAYEKPMEHKIYWISCIIKIVINILA